ncbi:MAG: hypothetical protein N2D54_03860, partial [Chloroflexota bacterium]
MDYGEILSRAAKIVSKHKILWLFGILASCASGGGSGPSSSFNYNIGSGDFFSGNGPFQNSTIPDEYILIFLAAMCFIFVLAIVFYLVGIVGRVGLIKGTHQVEAGAEALTLAELIQETKPYLLRAIGLNLLIALASIAIAVVIVVLAIPLTLVTFGLVWLCLIPLICLLIPLGLFVGIIVEQSNIALVIEDLDVFDALKRGWQVSRDNLGSVIVMGLILILGAGVITFIISIPIIFIVIPAVLGLAFETQYSAQSGIVIAGICLVVYLPVYIFLNGILQTYVH